MMKSPTSSRSRRAALVAAPAALLVLAACGSDSSSDQTAEEFYSGRQISLIVTQPPGGGFDTYARLYAQCMPEHLPGKPTIVVENMPGAGNIVGMNYLSTAADNDGSVFGTGEGSAAMAQLLGAEGVLYDMSEFGYLGMPDKPVNMILVARAEAGITSIDEVMDGSKTLKIGIAAPGSLLADPAILLKEVVGANVQLVPGYEGTGPLGLAVEQGEIDAFLVGDASLRAEYADKMNSGEWVSLLQSAEEGEPAYGGEFVEDIPNFESLADNEDDALLLKVGVRDRAYHRPYFTPAGVPEDRVEALKAAWEACTEDPEFIAQAEEAGRPIEPVDAETLQETYTGFIKDTPDATTETLKAMLTPEE